MHTSFEREDVIKSEKMKVSFASCARQVAKRVLEAQQHTLECDMNVLQREMDRLTAQLHDKQQRFWDLHRAIEAQDRAMFEDIKRRRDLDYSLFPIQDFPVEIIQRIFLHVIQSDDTAMRLRLTQVCRYWREAALGCPSLWSTILIRAANTRGSCSTSLRELERAKAASINIEMEYDWFVHRHVAEVEKHVRRLNDSHVLKAALLKKTQWNSLLLKVRNKPWAVSLVADLLADLRGAQLPHLRSIEFISGRSPDAGQFNAAMAALTCAADNLVSLTLQTAIDHTIPLSLSSVRELELRQCRLPCMPLLIPFLQTAPQLMSLRIFEPRYDHDRVEYAEGPYTELRLPHLRSLALDFEHDKQGIWFIRQCLCAQLQCLKLGGTGPQDPIFDGVLRAVSEKGWVLESLDLGDITFTDAVFRCLVKPLVHVARLRIGDEKNLWQLCYLMPALKEVVIKGVCDPVNIFMWLGSRNVPGLERLSSKSLSSWKAEDLKLLKGIVETGESSSLDLQPYDYPRTNV